MITETIADILDGPHAEEFFKCEFLAGAADALLEARIAADMTQEQVAEKLGTKQSAIARMEADTSGSMSLRRYFDYCVAVNALPVPMQLTYVKDWP